MKNRVLLLYSVFLVFLPIYFNPEHRNSFGEIPKLFISSIFVAGVLAWFVFAKIKFEKFQIRWNRGLVLISLFLISNIVSFIVSKEKYLAFWGEPALPAEALWSVIVFYLFSFLLLQFLEDEKDSRFLIKSLLISLTFQAFFGLLQKYDLAPLQITQEKRVAGTIGVTVAFATYLGCLLPFLVKKIMEALSKYASVFLSILLSAVMVAIGFSNSRTPFVIAHGIVLGILLLYVLVKERKRFYFQSACVMVALVLSALFLKLSDPNTEMAKKLTSTGINHSVSHRLIVWKAGIEAWKQHPFLGTGPETFLIAERPYQSAAMNEYTYWNEGWPKAHNHLVQALVCLGLLGFAVVLFVFLKLSLDAFRIWQQHGLLTDSVDLYFGYLYLFLVNLTAFNFVPTQLFTMLFPVLMYSSARADHTISLSLKKSLLRIFQLTVVAVTAVFLLEVVSFYRSNKLIATAEFWHNKEQYRAASDFALEAYAIAPDNPGASCQVSVSLASLLSGNISLVQKLSDVKNFNAQKEKAHETVAAIKSGIALSDRERQLVIEEINFFLSVCEKESGKRLSYKLLRATTKALLYSVSLVGLDDVIKEYKEAASEYPANPQPYFNMGIAYRMANREDDFVKSMEQAISLKADYLTPYLSLLTFYYEKKDGLQVDNLVKRIAKINFRNKEFVNSLSILASLSESENDPANARILKDTFEYQVSRIKSGELRY